MFEHSVIARMFGVSTPADAPVGHSEEPLRYTQSDRLEMVLAAAASGVECPSWIVLALEQRSGEREVVS
jgi:hypothetical protein